MSKCYLFLDKYSSLIYIFYFFNQCDLQFLYDSVYICWIAEYISMYIILITYYF